MTEEPIPKLIARLSVPTILSMLVTNIYNLVDTARRAGREPARARRWGVIFGYMAVLAGRGLHVRPGSGSIAARLLGSRDGEQASRTASTGVICSFGIISVVPGPVFR